MPTASPLLKYVHGLPLSRADSQEPAGLWIASVPWPRAKARNFSLSGRPTYVKPLGQWYDEPGLPGGAPRRLLMVADGGNRAPGKLSLTKSVRNKSLPPTAEAELFARSQPGKPYVWERHRLRIRYGGRSIALAMGVRSAGHVLWWEACRLVVLEETPTCRVVEMGGAIPVIPDALEKALQHKAYQNPFLHHHHWINGRLFARLHSNGVCEIFAHHLNAKFFDSGADFKDLVPVIGLQVDNAPPAQIDSLCGPWDGSQQTLALGDVRLDVSEASLLATPEQPGRMDRDGEFLVWQPYEGVDVFGGLCAVDTTGDPFLYHAKDRQFPRGMARTIRFSLSLSQRSPRVARYLAPAWWYGLCEEFAAESILPVSSDYDARIHACRQWLHQHQVQRGFESGSIARHHYGHHPLAMISPEHAQTLRAAGRDEPGWEGEIGYGAFLAAFLTGDARDYQAAMRSAYHFTDVAIDHAEKLARMHGYWFGAYAQPMNRLLATTMAYLETGDPYLLDTACAVVDAAYALHKNSWPRMAVGRDACVGRSALFLYRYFGDDHYRRVAYDIALAVAQSQRPDGSFGDQGGGAGIHMWAAYITKPWMALMATGCVLDYLQLFPDTQPLLACAQKTADWLMSVRFDHGGATCWSYQHNFDGHNRWNPGPDGQWSEFPTQDVWHQDTLAYMLGFVSLRYSDPRYLDAWAQSMSVAPISGDHAVSTALQFVPWLQAKLWRATLKAGRVRIQPTHFGPRTPTIAKILTPQGPVAVRWVDRKARLSSTRPSRATRSAP